MEVLPGGQQDSINTNERSVITIEMNCVAFTVFFPGGELKETGSFNRYVNCVFGLTSICARSGNIICLATVPWIQAWTGKDWSRSAAGDHEYVAHRLLPAL